MSLVDVRSRRRMSLADRALLSLPEAQPILARLDAATDRGFVDRADHVHRIACLVIRSKRNPTNKFAAPTL